MAVAKIRKISSWTMITVVLISIFFFGLFYFGGVEAEQWKDKYKTPTYTEELLLWFYAMLGICIVGMLIFAVAQFIDTFRRNLKGSLISLGVLVCFALLLVVTYSLGDGTPMQGLNTNSQKYNVENWLKISDMWIFTMTVLLALSIGSIVWGSLKKSFNK